jgi:hypothetical protein
MSEQAVQGVLARFQQIVLVVALPGQSLGVLLVQSQVALQQISYAVPADDPPPCLLALEIDLVSVTDPALLIDQELVIDQLPIDQALVSDLSEIETYRITGQAE